MINSIFLCVVCISPIVGIICIYNCIYFLKNKRELKNIDLEKIRDRVKKYKVKTIYYSIILAVLLSFIFIYTRPVSIYKITVLEGSDKIESLETWGNISYEIKGLDNLGSTSESEINDLSEENIEKIFNVLDNYSYKRTFNYSGMGGIGEFFSGVGKSGEWINITVWKSGYIIIPNDKVYRIYSENKENLYEELEEVMKEFE